MDPFLSEIRIFCGNFAPRGWAFCQGQLLSISQNTALFSLLGTTYGGNGATTFGLPNLMGCVPMHPGQGPGLSPRQAGDAIGAVSVQLGTNNLPAHTHGPLRALSSPGTADSPAGQVLAGGGSYAPTPDTTAESTSAAGQGAPVNVMQPFLALNFIIAIQGLYPSRP